MIESSTISVATGHEPQGLGNGPVSSNRYLSGNPEVSEGEGEGKKKKKKEKRRRRGGESTGKRCPTTTN